MFFLTLPLYKGVDSIYAVYLDWIRVANICASSGYDGLIFQDLDLTMKDASAPRRRPYNSLEEMAAFEWPDVMVL